MDVFLEPIELPNRVCIFGAGHVGLAVANALQLLGDHVEVIDSRSQWLSQERFPNAERTLGSPIDRANRLQDDAKTDVLVMTHDHALDEELAALILPKSIRYFGVIGSVRKRLKFVDRLVARGLPQDLVAQRFHCPIGLNIGSETPAEIAVSILAELVRFRRGFTNESAGPMSTSWSTKS